MPWLEGTSTAKKQKSFSLEKRAEATYAGFYPSMSRLTGQLEDYADVTDIFAVQDKIALKGRTAEGRLGHSCRRRASSLCIAQVTVDEVPPLRGREPVQQRAVHRLAPRAALA